MARAAMHGRRKEVDCHASMHGPQTTIRVGGKSSVIVFIITRRIAAGDITENFPPTRVSYKPNSGLWTRD